MLSLQITDYSMIIAFWLAFIRWSTVLFQLPIFDNVAIPNTVKVLTSLLMTYTFFPYISGEILKDIQFLGVENFWLLTVFYLMVGLIIGFLVKAIMHLYISSGAVITQQIGFAALRYFDPSAAQRMGPFEKLIQWTVLIMIISTGALLPMCKGTYGSFFSIHIYDIGKLAHSTQFFINFFKSLFVSALMLASPLIFTHVMLMSILGIIARMVPQMNIIMVSFVVNIGMGLLVFAVTSDEFFQVAYKLYSEKLGEWFQFIV